MIGITCKPVHWGDLDRACVEETILADWIGERGGYCPPSHHSPPLAPVKHQLI